MRRRKGRRKEILGWVGEQELNTAREVEQNLQGRGEKHQVGNRTNSFPIRKHTSFLPNFSPEFLLSHSKQDCFICQWVLATGSLSRCTPCWYRHPLLLMGQPELARGG